MTIALLWLVDLGKHTLSAHKSAQFPKNQQLAAGNLRSRGVNLILSNRDGKTKQQDT
jgi:hypothetical protein